MFDILYESANNQRQGAIVMKNRYAFQVAVSLFAILLPIGIYLYWEWYKHRPRTGPVGDGIIAEPGWQQISIMISLTLLGIFNFIVWTHRYFEYKKSLKANNER
jgi:hypothetical protein